MSGGRVVPVEWRGDEPILRILDQRRLPHEEVYLEARTAGDVAEAIASLAVRGAPLIGVAAGFGMALAAARSEAPGGAAGILRDLERAAAVLAASRPTAVNLSRAVERVGRAASEASGESADGVRRAAAWEALRIEEQERVSCAAIGRFGASLVPPGASILTHCNTGALATGGEGTAQAVITTAHDDGRQVRVWVDETRPVLQGARLTAWELQRRGVPMTLVADSAAGSLMAQGLVDLVLVGADRIAANGDTANKVGTYQLAVLARHHGIPFFVAAPFSTVDLSTATGSDIVIEARDPDEVVAPLGVPFAPAGTPAFNPAFDVTPAELITAIVTDLGVVPPPYRSSFARLEGRSPSAVAGPARVAAGEERR